MAAWCNQESQTQSSDRPTRQSQRRRWEKPPAGHVKVNCEAAFDVNTSSGGWGCILRDSDSDVVGAWPGRFDTLLNPLQGEIISCIQGVQAAIDAGVGRVVIETDALAVQQAVYSKAFDLSEVANLVAELRSLLSSNFISWRVQHHP